MTITQRLPHAHAGRSPIHLLGGLTLCLLITAGHAQAQPGSQPDRISQAISEARAALAAQRAGEAFDTLMALELEAAGDAGFDYWLGVAAVRAGDTEQAITALERVIMVQPGHAGARLELAGVFIMQNRYEEAEDQLVTVEQMNPPPAAQQAIQRYRQVMTQSGDDSSANAFSMLGLDAGYDSNYLNCPDSFDLFANTPLQGLAILSEGSTNYAQLRGLHYREFAVPQAFERGEWLTVVQSRRNADDNASLLDTSNLQTSLTLVSALSDNTELSVSASASQLWLDGDRYRQMLGTSLAIQRRFADEHRLTLQVRLRDNNFTDARNDHSTITGELSYSHQLNSRHQLRLQAAADQENTSGSATREGGDSMRHSADLQWRVGTGSDRHRFNTGISYQRLDYRRPGFAVFNQGLAALREDNTSSLYSEWTFQPVARWQFSSRLQHRHQTSSLDFFDMNQTVAQVTVNYLF